MELKDIIGTMTIAEAGVICDRYAEQEIPCPYIQPDDALIEKRISLSSAALKALHDYASGYSTL